MQVFGIDIAQITELVTQVANAGALHSLERVGEEMFETIIGIAIVAHTSS